MQKKSITLGVVFCIFILCSLTYQPIVANESLDTTLDETVFSKSNQFERIEIKSIINLLLDSIEKNGDCGCFEESEGNWHFPIICFLLEYLATYIAENESGTASRVIYDFIEILAKTFDCRWINP
jgi:hypothetical protein